MGRRLDLSEKGGWRLRKKGCLTQKGGEEKIFFGGKAPPFQFQKERPKY